MKSWTAGLIACVAGWLAIAAIARGEWIEVPPVRSAGYPGILGEIEDRMPGPTKWTGNPDPVLWAHEATHLLNSRISDAEADVYAVPGGRAFRILKPDHWVPAVFEGHPAQRQQWPVTGEEVSRAVPSSYRTPIWTFYLESFAEQDFPTGFLDELSAHVCGIEAGRRLGRDVRLDVQGAIHCREYSLALARLTRSRGYPRAAVEIEEFCAWCLAYLRDNGLVR